MIKIKFFILFTFFSVTANANIIYMSPSGNDANSGSISSPKFSLEGAVGARSSSQDTIYVRSGTFQFTSEQDLINVTGHSTLYLKIWAYPGESPVWTRSASYIPEIGVQTDLLYWENCSYIWVKGIEIANYSQDATLPYWFAFRGNPVDNCIFEQIKYHDNVGAFTVRGGTGNQFLCCDFYRNQDPYSTDAYGGADGLNITYVSNTAAVNYVKWCRAWWNSDDGFDFWDNNGTVIVDSCWAFWNGYIPGTFTVAGDGSGFKLGQTSVTSTSVRRVITNCISASNRKWGIVENNSLVNMQLYNNTTAHNGVLNFWFGAWGASPKTFTNNISFGGGELFGDFGYAIGSDAIATTNSWQGFTVTTADFQSTDSTQLVASRTNGLLPSLTYLKLVSGSDMVNTGTNVGYGDDLGALQYSATTPPPSTPPQNGFRVRGKRIIFRNQ